MVKEGVVRQQMKAMYEEMQYLCSQVFYLTESNNHVLEYQFCNVHV